MKAIRERIGGRSASALISLSIASAALLIQASLVTAQAEIPTGNYDRRAETTMLLKHRPSPMQTKAVRALREAMPDVLVAIDARTGATRSITNVAGTLTPAAPAGFDAEDVARRFATDRVSLLGLGSEDVYGMELTDRVFSKGSGTTHLYFQQTYLGIPVYNAQMQVHVARDGAVVGTNNRFLPEIRHAVNSFSPALEADAAVARGLAHLGLRAEKVEVLETKVSDSRLFTRVVVDGPVDGVSDEAVEAQLTWLPIQRGDARLVWQFMVDPKHAHNVFSLTVDALSGEVWTRVDHLSHAHYRVFPQPTESPMLPDGTIPADGRTLVVNPQQRATNASPSGWNAIGNTLFRNMQGNNAHAFDDRDNNGQPPSTEPFCGLFLGSQCDFPLNLGQSPSSYIDAATANLFYWVNLVHDIQYQYGFDEVAGNFQETNFGRGGQGGDRVRARAQVPYFSAPAQSIEGPYFLTLQDGIGSPNLTITLNPPFSAVRDASFDNLVIVHEYGHGISQRQVGGPSTVSCLSNDQQMGEGWSDWLGLVYTAEPGDSGTDGRGVGNYFFGQAPTGPGVRPKRYSTSTTVNSYTYQSIVGDQRTHSVGSVWAQALWEVYWELVDEHGFDADLYDAAGGAGNQRAMLYVNEGMKRTACSPSFLDARNGVVSAAGQLLDGEDLCRVWDAFARFGLGSDARSGSSYGFSGIANGFQIPACCSAPTPVRPAYIDTHDGPACENTQATYFTNHDPSAYRYEWELINAQGQVVRSAGTPTFSLLGLTVGAGTYTLRVRTATCREKSAWRSTTVVVQPEGAPGCGACNPFFDICFPI